MPAKDEIKRQLAERSGDAYTRKLASATVRFMNADIHIPGG